MLPPCCRPRRPAGNALTDSVIDSRGAVSFWWCECSLWQEDPLALGSIKRPAQRTRPRLHGEPLRTGACPLPSAPVGANPRTPLSAPTNPPAFRTAHGIISTETRDGLFGNCDFAHIHPLSNTVGPPASRVPLRMHARGALQATCARPPHAPAPL